MNPERTYSTLIISRTSKKPGFWIGDTLVQVTQDGGKIRVAITAAKTTTILRGELVADDVAFRAMELAPYSIEREGGPPRERNIPAGNEAPFLCEQYAAACPGVKFVVRDARGDEVYTARQQENSDQ